LAGFQVIMSGRFWVITEGIFPHLQVDIIDRIGDIGLFRRFLLRALSPSGLSSERSYLAEFLR
jgi:hypothetical protein